MIAEPTGQPAAATHGPDPTFGRITHPARRDDKHLVAMLEPGRQAGHEAPVVADEECDGDVRRQPQLAYLDTVQL
jgi:hypothetical protein